MSVFCIVSVLKNHYQICFLKIKLYIFKWNVDGVFYVKAAETNSHSKPKIKGL